MDRRKPNPDTDSVREIVLNLVNDVETMSNELNTLKNSFETHEREESQKFDSMINAVKTMSNELKTLKNSFETHEREESQKFDSMINAVNQNTTSIDKLTTETKAIVELHRDAKGVINIASALQKFALWVTKWGAVGTGVYLALKWARENLEWTNLL